VYVADTGNGRVRVIGPDRKIHSLVGTFSQPSGLALGRGGSLYVATATSVVKLDQNGRRTTFAHGHGRFAQITVGKHRYGAFGPSYLALDAGGDLYAFSFGTKTIVEFSPSGKPLHAWQAYANGLAEAPDGSILVAGHGGTLRRIRQGRLETVFDFSRSRLAGYPNPGAGVGFDPDGIAVDSRGTIYTDTFVGNGWTNQTALAAITPSGHGRLLKTTTPPAHTLPAVGASGFPMRLYPQSPAVLTGGDPSACPGLGSLRPFDRSTRAAAIDAARRIDRSPLWSGLKLSDRSWWTGFYTDQIDGHYEQGLHRVVSVGPAIGDPYSSAVAHACGRRLVQSSLAVVVGPGVYSDQISHLFFLNRDGHALLYWQHT
jgi:sugar lactone lactonase YvrE